MKKLIYRIATVTLLLSLAACQESQKYYDGVYIMGTEGKEVTATLTVDDLPSAIAVNVASSDITQDDVTVSMKESPELVESFNKKFHKNYVLLPKNAYKLENTALKIEAGKHVSSQGMKLNITSRDELKEGTTYLLPVSIADVSDKNLSVIEASRTLYIVVNQIIITRAANLEDSYCYYRVNFGSQPEIDTKACKQVTYEARVRFRRMTKHSRKWCFSVMGLEENFCLRTAGSNKDGWKLQLAGNGHVDSRDVLPNDKWVHLACVFDSDKGKKYIYINGELQGEIVDSRKSIDLTSFYAQKAFYIGQTAADDRYMDGWVSEVRVWTTARTAAELKNNVCWVDPTTKGLLAYWRFNESSAENERVVTDITGHGFHATFSGWGKPKFVDAVRCPE